MRSTIEDQIERKLYFLLSHIDRDRYSGTYGCCDRLYWGWKLKDFPDATLQRYVYPLSKILLNKDRLDREYLDLIIGTYKYVKKIQHSDGSVDQAFPHEHSHGATAFLLFDLSQTYLLIKDLLSPPESQFIISLLEKLGDYLVRRDEKHGFISNHLLGAGAGLMKLFLITGNDKYQEKAKYYTKLVLSRQSEEGWFLEYDGADPGYQTLGIYYLAHYYQDGVDPYVLESLEKAVRFVSYFIHPDGSFGGEYGSRNTEIFYPGGFELIKNEIPESYGILSFMAESINDYRTVNLDFIDTGNLAPLINNYLEIDTNSLSIGKSKKTMLPMFSECLMEFKNAGIIIHSNSNYYTVIGISKGGVIKSFRKDSGKRVLNECGYIGRIGKRGLLSNQILGKNNYWIEENRIILKSSFYKFQHNHPTILLIWILRSINITIGRIRFFREVLKTVMVRRLMKNHKATKYKLSREILLWDKPDVKDSISPNLPPHIKLEKNIQFSTIHMASSKYWDGIIKT